MTHEVVWEPEGVCRRFWGSLRASEYAAIQSDAYGDPRFDDLHYILVDFTEVTDFIATVDETEEILASTVGAYLSNPKLRVAVVTRNDRLAAILDQLGDLSAYPLRLFGTIAEARRWINSRD